MDKTQKRKIISLVSLIALLIVMIVVGYFIGKPLLKYVAEPEKFREWVADHGIWGQMAMIGLVMVQVIIALIPGEPFEVGAGYAFGAVEGAILCTIGFTLASAIIFSLVRRFGYPLVELFFGREKLESISFLQNSKKLDVLTFILFLIPGTPKDVLVYFMGLTPMKMWVFLLITGVARQPSLISSVLTGSMLGSQHYYPALIIYSITAVLTVLCIFLYRTHTKKTNEKTKEKIIEKTREKTSSEETPRE